MIVRLRLFLLDAALLCNFVVVHPSLERGVCRLSSGRTVHLYWLHSSALVEYVLACAVLLYRSGADDLMSPLWVSWHLAFSHAIRFRLCDLLLRLRCCLCAVFAVCWADPPLLSWSGLPGFVSGLPWDSLLSLHRRTLGYSSRVSLRLREDFLVLGSSCLCCIGASLAPCPRVCLRLRA